VSLIKLVLPRILLEVSALDSVKTPTKKKEVFLAMKSFISDIPRFLASVEDHSLHF
jgi:hypothetical protein